MDYFIAPGKYYSKKMQKLVNKNLSILPKIIETLKIMELDPFDSKINTHKVYAKIGLEAYSSRVTGDIRIIWNFDQDKIKVIDLLDIGGHSGNNTVY